MGSVQAIIDGARQMAPIASDEATTATAMSADADTAPTAMLSSAPSPSPNAANAYATSRSDDH